MAPAFAFVAFLIFQPALAGKTSCDAANVADDTQCLLQTDATLKKGRRTSSRDVTEESEQNVMKATDSVEEELMLHAEEESSESEKVHLNFIPRPSVGKGPDVITFGMMAKVFYGVNVKGNDFTIDMVLTLIWNDKRNIKLIPAGAENITLSQEEANKQVWLPEIAVTNRYVKKFQIISTAVELHRDGRVVKVQRVEVRVMDMYNLAQYPFDSQDLKVKIASSQYMLNAVVLKPSNDKAYSGINHADSFLSGTGFDLKGWSMDEYEDEAGLLKKSRGLFSIHIKRQFGAYRDDHVIPSICIVLLACGCFFFPFIGPFVVPRLLMSIIAYLVFTHLKGQSESKLPSNAPNTWNDVLNTNIMLLMLVAVFINMYAEVRFHVTKVGEVAALMNFEMKVIMPLLSGSIFIAALVCGANDCSQTTVDIIIKIVMAVTMGGYVVLNESRTNAALNKGADLQIQ